MYKVVQKLLHSYSDFSELAFSEPFLLSRFLAFALSRFLSFSLSQNLSRVAMESFGVAMESLI